MINRQQMRRHDRKEAKAFARKTERDAIKAHLIGMRADRAAREKLSGRRINQGPGKLASSRRLYDKPHGQANWRSRDLSRLPNGQPVPEGCEATFHHTKGLRVMRTAS